MVPHFGAVGLLVHFNLPGGLSWGGIRRVGEALGHLHGSPGAKEKPHFALNSALPRAPSHWGN